MTDGLLDARGPVVAILAVVALVAWFSAIRYSRVSGDERRSRGRTDPAGGTCPYCDTHHYGWSRSCNTCKNWRTILDDPAATRGVMFLGWLPALFAAVIGGTWAPSARGSRGRSSSAC